MLSDKLFILNSAHGRTLRTGKTKDAKHLLGIMKTAQITLPEVSTRQVFSPVSMNFPLDSGPSQTLVANLHGDLSAEGGPIVMPIRAMLHNKCDTLLAGTLNTATVLVRRETKGL